MKGLRDRIRGSRDARARNASHWSPRRWRVEPHVLWRRGQGDRPACVGGKAIVVWRRR